MPTTIFDAVREVRNTFSRDKIISSTNLMIDIYEEYPQMLLELLDKAMPDPKTSMLIEQQRYLYGTKGRGRKEE